MSTLKYMHLNGCSPGSIKQTWNCGQDPYEATMATTKMRMLVQSITCPAATVQRLKSWQLPLVWRSPGVHGSLPHILSYSRSQKTPPEEDQSPARWVLLPTKIRWRPGTGHTWLLSTGLDPATSQKYPQGKDKEAVLWTEWREKHLYC